MKKISIKLSEQKLSCSQRIMHFKNLGDLYIECSKKEDTCQFVYLSEECMFSFGFIT